MNIQSTISKFSVASCFKYPEPKRIAKSKSTREESSDCFPLSGFGGMDCPFLEKPFRLQLLSSSLQSHSEQHICQAITLFFSFKRRKKIFLPSIASPLTTTTPLQRQKLECSISTLCPKESVRFSKGPLCKLAWDVGLFFQMEASLGLQSEIIHH